MKLNSQISLPYITATANVLLPEKINESHLGMDTRNISDPIVDILKISQNHARYNCLKTLECVHTHPIDRYRVALLYLEEFLYSDETSSVSRMGLFQGGLFEKSDWSDDLKKKK